MTKGNSPPGSETESAPRSTTRETATKFSEGIDNVVAPDNQSHSITLPKRSNGRPSAQASELYQAELVELCTRILELNSRLDFRVGSRGWCYILEEYGLGKGDFDGAQDTTNDCRKRGLLPLDICAEDGKRQPDNLERIDNDDPSEWAEVIVDYVQNAQHTYNPFSFWDYQDSYVEVVVEKVDLKSLFSSVCADFHVPITNAGGWTDINSRAQMAARFAEHEADGKVCILAYCGDHDPGGLNISGFIRENFAQVSGATHWHPDNLVIVRFGLNYDFIEENNLTWIDNLETAKRTKPNRLDDPRHPDHYKPYVQNYIREFGARKCEANALVVRPEAGRKLCRDTILKYISLECVAEYKAELNDRRSLLQSEINKQLRDLSSR